MEKATSAASGMCHGSTRWMHLHSVLCWPQKVLKTVAQIMCHMHQPVTSPGDERCMARRELAGASAGDQPPLDGVVHITAAEESTNPATILNAALRHIFPSNSAIPPTAAVSILEDHQVGQPYSW